MTNPSVSVVVVSRGRPKLLQLCLLAISQLRYEHFEVIVVADQGGLDAIQSAGMSGRIKTALCNVANISVARNIGLELAAGDVVAFLDDDCVPEPGWLYHLAPVFNDPDVDAAGGYVRGRNGISFQSKAQTIDCFGYTGPLDVVGDGPIVKTGTAEKAIKTVGTNCAFRRSLFEKIDGFDPAFSYYLDESDVNLRIGFLGRKTAIVPLAEVHHQSAASDLRRANRVPHSLQQVGKSTAIFLRKHCHGRNHRELLEEMLGIHRRQLLQHMMKGRCKRRDIDRLLETLKAGMKMGQAEALLVEPSVQPSDRAFMKFKPPIAFDDQLDISGYRIHGTRLRKMASDGVRDGKVVSLFVFSRTSLFHRVKFHSDGYWEQTGGIFGRAVRSEPLFQLHSLESRARKEANRVALVRNPWQTEVG